MLQWRLKIIHIGYEVGLRFGDSPTEKTVEWMPIFTDSVIRIFGFSPFFSPLLNCSSICQAQSCYHNKLIYMSIIEFCNQNSHKNPWYYIYHSEKERVSYDSFNKHVCFLPNLKNVHSSRCHELPYLSVSLLPIMLWSKR